MSNRKSKVAGAFNSLGAPTSPSARRKNAEARSATRPVLTPKLRFPEFRDAPGWEESELWTLADPVSERAENDDQNNILTLSGEQGLVLQSDYFGKKIAGANAERYLRIQQDDFVYNDRVTKASAYGTIKRLKNHPNGIVSPIYKCFRFKESELPGFWEWYFEAGAHESQLRSLANEGARAGRFNVSIDRFLSTSVWAPDSTSPEQHRIASCLSSLDDLISAERQKLDALKAHKKGLMQHLFPREGETRPRLRFPEFPNALEWSQKPTNEIADVLQGYGFPERYQGKRQGDYPFYKVSDISRTLDAGSRYIVEAAHYIDHQTLKDLKAKTLPAGTTIFAKIGEALRLNKRVITTKPCVIDNNVAGVKAIKGKATDLFLYYLWSTVSLADYSGGVVPAVNKSAIEAILVTHPLVEEQQRIASCLTSLDDLIAAQTDKLESLKSHKKGLMQQLFPVPEEVEA
jgi:type I restriction enzyme, S subunit